MIAATIVMIVANSPFAELYDALFDTSVAVQIGALSIIQPLLLWVNDGLMAVHFFPVGLEIKREVTEGELASMMLLI